MKKSDLVAGLEVGALKDLRKDPRDGCPGKCCTEPRLKRPAKGEGSSGPGVAQKEFYSAYSTAREGVPDIWTDADEADFESDEGRALYWGDIGKEALEFGGKTPQKVHSAMSHIEVELARFNGASSGQILNGRFYKGKANGRVDKSEEFAYDSFQHPDVSILKSSKDSGAFDSSNPAGDDNFRLWHTQSEKTIKNLRLVDYAKNVATTQYPWHHGLTIQVPKSALTRVKISGASAEDKFGLKLEWTLDGVGKSFACDDELKHDLIVDLYPFIQNAPAPAPPLPQSYDMLTKVEVCGDASETTVYSKFVAIHDKAFNATVAASFYNPVDPKKNGVYGAATEVLKVLAESEWYVRVTKKRVQVSQNNATLQQHNLKPLVKQAPRKKNQEDGGVPPANPMLMLTAFAQLMFEWGAVEDLGKGRIMKLMRTIARLDNAHLDNTVVNLGMMNDAEMAEACAGQMTVPTATNKFTRADIYTLSNAEGGAQGRTSDEDEDEGVEEGDDSGSSDDEQPAAAAAAAAAPARRKRRRRPSPPADPQPRSSRRHRGGAQR